MKTKIEIGNKVYCAIHGYCLGVVIAINSDDSIRIAGNVKTARNAKNISTSAIALNPSIN